MSLTPLFFMLTMADAAQIMISASQMVAIP
jgi:hypothetical protein